MVSTQQTKWGRWPTPGGSRPWTPLWPMPKPKARVYSPAAVGSAIAATSSRSPFWLTSRTTPVPCTKSHLARSLLLSPVRTLDEAIERANTLPYGLAAYGFTHSANNAERLAEGIEAGNISINHFVASIAETPFGGVKESGFGREGGIEGLQCYTVAKNVSHLTL